MPRTWKNATTFSLRAPTSSAVSPVSGLRGFTSTRAVRASFRSTHGDVPSLRRHVRRRQPTAARHVQRHHDRVPAVVVVVVEDDAEDGDGEEGRGRGGSRREVPHDEAGGVRAGGVGHVEAGEESVRGREAAGVRRRGGEPQDAVQDAVGYPESREAPRQKSRRRAPRLGRRRACDDQARQRAARRQAEKAETAERRPRRRRQRRRLARRPPPPEVWLCRLWRWRRRQEKEEETIARRRDCTLGFKTASDTCLLSCD
mmetsp:Transcript_19721/g.61022  ORF Transcript_19721/g.61022 Transcript_19721/m.61022 type:complete len:257 (-) Transcript_19721:64-834(-)